MNNTILTILECLVVEISIHHKQIPNIICKSILQRMMNYDANCHAIIKCQSDLIFHRYDLVLYIKIFLFKAFELFLVGHIKIVMS